jgi:hypothetical protein
MAKVELTNRTFTTTSTETVILNDDTIDIEKVVAMVVDSSTVAAFGYGDTVDNFTGSIKHLDKNTTKTITFYKDVSSVKTKVFEATITNLDIGEFSINVTTCTQNTKVWFLCYGS